MILEGKTAVCIEMKKRFGNFILSDESEGGINASPSLTGKRRPGRPRIPGRRGKKPGNLSFKG
jgi:hypothetical protein